MFFLIDPRNYIMKNEKALKLHHEIRIIVKELLYFFIFSSFCYFFSLDNVLYLIHLVDLAVVINVCKFLDSVYLVFKNKIYSLQMINKQIKSK